MSAQAPKRYAARLGALLSWAVALGVLGVFGLILLDILSAGVGQLGPSFIMESPADAGRAGGIASVLVSTLALVTIALTAATPSSVACALWLYARQGKLRWLGRSLDVLAAVPSVVFGLFGQVCFGEFLGLGYSLWTGGLTLACMISPMLVSATLESLRALPAGHRASAAALGLTERQVLLKVLLPAAAPGVIVGLTLGLGRAVSETAALLFTSGYVDRMPESLWDSGRSLSVHIYDLSMNVAGGEPNAYGAAAVLLIILWASHSVTAAVMAWLRRHHHDA